MGRLPSRKVNSNSKSPKAIGRIGELIVKRWLEEKGWEIIEDNPNSGKTDLMARKNRRLWLIQVKTTTRNSKPYLSPSELKGLKSRATKLDAVPVIAYVFLSGEGFRPEFYSLRSGRRLEA